MENHLSAWVTPFQSLFFACPEASNEEIGMVVNSWMKMIITVFCCYLLQVARVQSTGGSFTSALLPVQDGHQDFLLQGQRNDQMFHYDVPFLQQARL